MKQSTSFAQVANNFLTVLQGYSKTIRLLLVMFLTLTVTTNAWGADVTFATSTYNGKGGASGEGGKATATIEGVTITSTKAYYTSEHIREYSGGTITVSSSSNITKIVFTSTASGKSNNGPSKISINSGGGNYSYSGSNGTWTGASSTVTFKCNAQFRWKQVVVTTASSHTVTWTINPAAGGSLSSTNGTSTTVNPNVAYTYGSPAYTVTPAGKANVSQDGDNFTATPSANCTIQINMVEKTPATISFENMGNPIPTTTGYYVGDTYTLPATNDYTCGDKTFVGWSTKIIENSATKPTAATYFEPGASVTLAAHQTFYAVFATSSGNGSGYTKLNWGATISAGKYLISTGNYTISGRSGNKTSELAVVEYSPTSNEAKTEYEVKIEKIGDYFSIKLPDDTWWVGWNTSTSTNLTNTSPNNDTDYLWRYTENGIQNISAGTRYLQVNYANSAAKVYTTTNTNTWHATYLYAQATSYTDYTTQCTIEPSYSVTYNGNGNTSGSVPTDDTKYANDAQVTVLGNTGNLAKTGYTFSGWNTKEDGTGTPYVAGDKFTITEITTLYAKWTAIQTTITLNANGGSGNTISVAATYDSSTLSPSSITNPTQTGHTFGGWYSGEGGTGSLVINSSGKLQANVSGFTGTNGVWKATTNKTLYAKWTPAVYTITYNDQGNAAFSGKHEAGYPQNHTYNTETTLKSASKEHYTFGGWYKESNCSGHEVTTLGATEYTDNITLYAKWTANTYTITFNAGTGECVTGSATTTNVGGVTLPTATHTCPDWTFAGWWTEEVSSTNTSPGTLFNAGDTYNPTSDIILYAVYSTQEAGDAFTGYAKVTTAPDDWSGKYLLSTGTYTANGTYDSNGANGHLVRETYTPGNEEKADWEFTLAKVGNTGYSILFPDGSYYLGYASSTNFARSTTVVQSDNKAYLWSPSTSGITNVGDNTRIIKDGGSDFRPYVNDNSIVYLYKRVGGGSTTIYNSNPTCLVPVWTGATIDKTNLTVNCGERSPMTGANSAAKITFPTEKIYNFTKDITIEATSGFLVSTSQSEDANYKSSVSLSPLVGTTNANTFYDKFVYVRAEAPAMSEEDLLGTITIKNNKGETLQTFSVTADVTCTQYTLTLNDRGTKTTAEYYAGASVPKPEDPTGVCTDPIHYVFDGWATAPVTNGTEEYDKVDFSTFTMPNNNTTIFAVYRYAEEGGEPVNGYVKVTEALADWSGDYVIVNETAKKAIGNTYANTKTLSAVDVEIEDDKVVSPSESIIWQIRKDEDNYTMYNAKAETYAYITGTKSENAGLSDTKQNITISWGSNASTVRVCGSGDYTARCFSYFSTNSEWRTYSTSGNSTGALYRSSNKTIRYTSSLVCGSIEAENAIVTSTVGQTIKVYVPITLDSSTGATTINATSDNAAFAVTGLIDVEAGNHTIVVEYTPAEYNITETANITLSATNGATTTFTVIGRSLPKKFAMVVEKDGKFYALPADMPSAGTYAGYEVEVKDNAIVTAPATYVYSLSAVHNSRYADNGTAVRFVGNDNKCLWASKEKDGTNIRNSSQVENAKYYQYEWNLSTTDGERYTISSSVVADAERILRLYNQKFGMYKDGVSAFYFLPLMASTEDAKVLSSAFSVSATEKVQFSAGNLQYHTGDQAWRFAPEQYDYVGDDNANIGEPTFEGWIDMFGWSADGKYGVNTSINNDDYQGEFVDWGTLFPDEWYTLSKNEWLYLLFSRTNATNLKQLAKVGDVYGVLLFPDEWVMPYDVATPSHDEFNRYSYSLEDWQKLEIAGAVFLPAAGRRSGADQVNTNHYTYYWTSTKETPDKVYYLINCHSLGNDQYKYALPELWHEKGLYGQSVRLARKLMPLQVVEWKENSVVVMCNGDPAQTATITINNEQKGTATLSDVRKDEAVYELPATDLASSPNQPLEIAIGTAKVTMTIPYIATTTTTNVPNNSDLVILKDATFTATNEQLRNVTVYGGGELVVGEGATLSTNSLTLRIGGVTADGNYDYVYPQFLLKGTWSNTSGKINLDYLTTKEQYYTFVTPFAVNTKDIKYPVDIYGSNVAPDNTGSFEFQYYDGAARAEGNTGWTVVPEGDDGANLEAGQGYTFLGMPKKINGTRQKYGIHRIPMSVSAADAMSHEKTDQTISVAPHPSAKNNNSGWNLIGNPYMATIGGLTNEDIQVGELVHTNDANGNWTGGWHWDEQTVQENQRFLVFPSNDGQSFSSTQASNATLPAFKNFFVQIGNKDANALVIPYNKPTNVLAAPARRTEEVDQDIELAIVLEQDEAHSDQLDFLINNIYTEDFERDADFTKMMNATNLNLYGVHPYDNLSFVAIDNNTARGSVAIGYQVPQAGEYTLRMSDKPYIMWDKFEALYVTDHEMSPEVTTDIMSEPYRFTVANAETNHTRFTVSVILKVEEDDGGGDVGTGVDNTTNNNTPSKFIYQDKMYILRNGVIYDAMGKQVQTINK